MEKEIPISSGQVIIGDGKLGAESSWMQFYFSSAYCKKFWYKFCAHSQPD